MFRYTPALTVFDGWRLEDNELVPVRAAPARSAAAASRSARAVDLSLVAAARAELADPARAASAIRDKYESSLHSCGRLLRGVSSSSDRRWGSLHVLARPLRAAVYAVRRCGSV